jgi:hypothetical protein
VTEAQTSTALDLDRLFKLRLVVARHGEMDASRWWNTGDAARGSALLGRAGRLLMSRGFPRTHHFAQARVVFAVARARCAEVFDPPGCVTLWSLPATIEDQLDARWAKWLEEGKEWEELFAAIEAAPSDLLETMKELEMVREDDVETVSVLKRSAEGRAVPIPGVHAVDDQLVTLLAAAFSRGEPGKLAVPYARLEG